MNKKICYILFMVVFAVVIVLNFGIHVVRTQNYNEQKHEIVKDDIDSDYTFTLNPQNDKDISWTRTATIDGEEVNLNACSYEAEFTNKSDIEISDWTLRININSDCYINSAWCGTTEIHQYDGDVCVVQTVDLRDINTDELKLKYYEDGDLYLIPLHKGDYIIYYPNEIAKEKPIVAINGNPVKAAIGFIFYWDNDKELCVDDYSVTYYNRKGYFQGTEAIICLITSTIWFIMFIGGISTIITIRIMKKRTELELAKKHNDMLYVQVAERTKQIYAMQQKVVLGLAELIENRDSNTGGHVKRTSEVIKILVDEAIESNYAKIDEVKAIDIVRAAPMHDLGKINIDSNILCKTGKLSEEEFSIMKTHAAKSGDIVRMLLYGVEESHFVDTAYNVARYHHERWDGKGYPDGLLGEDIPVEARIMAVADVYDALVSRRCYKEPIGFEEASNIICESMGTQFDPRLKDVFLKCKDKIEYYYRQRR